MDLSLNEQSYINTCRKASVLFGFDLGQPEYIEGIKSIFPFLLIALPFGSLGEELGWRSFMLPNLLKKYNIWKSSSLF